MSDLRNQQEVTVPLMDDTAFGAELDVPYIDGGPSAETCYSGGQLAASELNESSHAFSRCSDDNKSVTVPRVAGNVTDEIDEFIPGMRRFFKKNIHGEKLLADGEERYHQLFSDWNTFLQQIQGILGSSAIISSDIKDDIDKYIPWQEDRRGSQWTEDNKKWINTWLPRWNMFLQARAGEMQVTRLNLCLTVVGFIFYIVDMASDIGTSVYYASNGQWGRAMVTLAMVYAAVIIHTGVKWNEYVCCTVPIIHYINT